MENATPFKKGELLGPTPMFDQEINEKRKKGYSVFSVPFTLEEDPTICAEDEATIPVKVKINNIYVKVVPLSVRYFRRYDASLAKAEDAAKRSKMDTEQTRPQVAAHPIRSISPKAPKLGGGGDEPQDELERLLSGLQEMHDLFKEKLGALESYEKTIERLAALEQQVKSFLESTPVELNAELEGKVERILSLLENFQSNSKDLSDYEVRLVPKVTSGP